MSNIHNSARSQNSARQQTRVAGPVSVAASRSLRLVMIVLAACLAGLGQAPTLRAQSHKSKVPIVGKLSPGKLEQAYSGRVQSLDLKQKILSVNSLHGQDSEIFPIKKNVRVENLGGERLKLTALKPGTTVLIYYNQKSNSRTVKNIVILSAGKNQGKGKPAPSS